MGYLNLPTETEETFVANPLDTEPNERLFRTGGDLGRTARSRLSAAGMR